METLPLIVKAQDPSGATHEVHCDTRQRAEELLIEFRRTYRKVWVEDAKGRKAGGN